VAVPATDKGPHLLAQQPDVVQGVIAEPPKRLGGDTLLPSAAVGLAAEGGTEGIQEGHFQSPIGWFSCVHRRSMHVNHSART
jgi:hypothetical protein